MKIIEIPWQFVKNEQSVFFKKKIGAENYNFRSYTVF
jgi:hypothetical protein